MAVFIMVFAIAMTTVLTGCMNLYGAVDKPSGDPQLLSAARACFDRGDYVCAKEYYQQVSNSSADARTSELVLTTLAENNIFTMGDLITALGTGRGGKETFRTLSQTMAARGKLGAETRQLISVQYQNASGIADPYLRAFTQFVSSTAMFSVVLGNAVAADGILTNTDLVVNPATCATVGGGCTVAGSCAVGTGTDLTSTTTSASMSVTANWSGPATLGQLIGAAVAAESTLNTLNGGGSSGTFAVIQQLSGVSGLAGCIRQQLLPILF